VAVKLLCFMMIVELLGFIIIPNWNNLKGKILDFYEKIIMAVYRTEPR